MTSLQAYVARLVQLVALAEAGDFTTINTQFGVCIATQDIDINSGTIDLVTVTWEHFSGNLMYPIPVTSSRYGDVATQYHETKNLWRGKQLTMRISYMKHLIKELS